VHRFADADSALGAGYAVNCAGRDGNVTDADDVQGLSGQGDQISPAEVKRWSRDLQKFERSRLERVQASARV
jgi:hypothetical protein